MAISQAMCTSFKQELLQGIHNLTSGSGGGTTTTTGSGNAFKIALTNVTPTTSSTTALTDFADTTWGSSSITARGAVIYNSSTTAGSANRAVLVLNFGSDKASSSGDFTITFPTADASSAIIRIA